VPISSIISSSDPEALAYRCVSTVLGDKMWGRTASISESLAFSGSTPASVVDETAAVRGTELLSEHVKSIEDVLTFLITDTLIASVTGRVLDSWFLSPFELPDEELEPSALGGLNGGDGSRGSLD